MCYIKDVLKSIQKSNKIIQNRIIESNQIIKYQEYPLCKNCIYFKENTKFPNLSNYKYEYGTCKKFGIKDVVSGKIMYENAHISRSDNNMCKKIGLYFIKNNEKLSENENDYELDMDIDYNEYKRYYNNKFFNPLLEK